MAMTRSRHVVLGLDPEMPAKELAQQPVAEGGGGFLGSAKRREMAAVLDDYELCPGD